MKIFYVFSNILEILHTCLLCQSTPVFHYSDVIMGTIESQITSLTIVYSTVYSGADPRKHQSSASLAFVREIQRSPVNSPHKWPATRKMFPFDDVIMFMANTLPSRRLHCIPLWTRAKNKPVPRLLYLDGNDGTNSWVYDLRIHQNS